MFETGRQMEAAWQHFQSNKGGILIKLKVQVQFNEKSNYHESRFNKYIDIFSYWVYIRLN